MLLELAILMGSFFILYTTLKIYKSIEEIKASVDILLIRGEQDDLR